MTENDEMSEIINKNNTETSNDSKSKNVGNDSDESNETSDIKPLVVEKQVAGYIDHLAISQSLGYQIFRKDRRNTWTPEEDKCLKELLIAQYLKINQLEKYNNEPINVKHIDWIEIANHMSTKRKGKECKKRWSSSLDPFLRKGKWTQAEDDALIQAFKKYGSLWQKVASEIEGRNEDQCSKRYTEVLNSDTKERLKPWTLDEDLTLIDKVKQFGTKWRQISAYLPSRPSLTCRNRWRKIMTDIAKDTASDVIKKAIGVLDKNGKPIVKFQKTEDLTRERKDKKKAQNSSSNFKGIRKRSNSPLSENQSEIEERTSSNTEEHNDSTRHRFTGPPNKKIKKSTHTQESTGNENKQHNHKTGHKHNKDNDKTSTSYQRIASPSRTQTDWSFSLIDPRTNEEMKSYSANINTHELAHYLIELARFNGVTLAVHQHIHHHYSSGTPNANVDPQSNISRYGHFNYLPPLMEVPKLTSSSSPDNTVDSQTSNKNFPENSLLRLLNNEEEHTSKKSKHKSSKNSGDVNDTGKSFSKSHRQQLYPSNSTPNSNISTPLTPSFQENGNTDKSNYSSNSASSNNNNNSSSSNNNNNNNNNANNKNNNDRKSYITEDINEELDFWETMRSMNHPKNSKPVSQHHPLHYNQPSNYKEQLPYQPSDSFGIQRFPNMATPLATNMIDADSKGTPSVQTNITSINTDGGYGGMYMNGQNPDPDEEEEEEMDIANQYGMYYSIFANKGQSVYGSYGKQNGGNGVNNGGATGLINSGYLMPFNPS